MSVRLATATTDLGASRAIRTRPRDHSVISPASGSLRCATGTACKYASAACAPAPPTNISGRVREIGQTTEGYFRFEVDAQPPECQLALRTGIHKREFKRTLRPSVEIGVCGAGRNCNPAVSERGTQRIAVADQMMEACNRAILLRLDDVKLRAASWAHGSVWGLILPPRRNRRLQRLAHIQIIRDW